MTEDYDYEQEGPLMREDGGNWGEVGVGSDSDPLLGSLMKRHLGSLAASAPGSRSRSDNDNAIGNGVNSHFFRAGSKKAGFRHPLLRGFYGHQRLNNKRAWEDMEEEENNGNPDMMEDGRFYETPFTALTAGDEEEGTFKTKRFMGGCSYHAFTPFSLYSENRK
jgi:hypothetical protein